jgi:hypothetical protein
MRAFICGVLTALVITGAIAAEDISSTSYMLHYCKLTDKEMNANTRNAIAFGRCHGMAQTIGELFVAVRDMQAQGVYQLHPAFCTTMPKSATSTELVDVVLKYAEAHPEHTHLPFIPFAMIAIRNTWPCVYPSFPR